MSYKINKTDGSLLVEVVDSNIDQTATDLTIIGKNTSSYGEFINENFVRLLENFASETAPSKPITGQLWFDISENRLKVYDGNGFRSGSGPVVAGARPTTLVQGDLWIDSVENQLYFYDGVDLQLAGPIYKNSQGISGNTVENIIDTNNIQRTIVKLWVGDVLLGIFSKEVVPFTPLSAIPGFSGEIGPGFNQSTLAGQKFRVTVSKADALVSPSGQITTANDFMKTNSNTSTTGTITIQNSLPLIIGTSANNEVRSDSINLQINSNTSGQNFRLRTRNPSGIQDAITVNATSETVGIFNDTPLYTLDVAGTVRISGNLLVEGATTSINSTNLVIEDHVIELANNTDSSVSDSYADQGGIVLKGTTDHKIIWDSPTTAWKSTESFDVASSRDYKVNGVSVLSSTTLGSTVVNSSLTSLGTLSLLNVDFISINDNIISTSGNQNIVLAPDGTGDVLLDGSPRIRGMGDPIDPQDATTKSYVDDLVRARTLTLSMDITGLSDTDIEDILAEIAPEPEYDIGAECRIHCTRQVVTYNNVEIDDSIFPVTTGPIVKTFISVDKAGGNQNQSVLADFVINNLNLGAASITVTRVNKLFRLDTDSTVTKWVYINDF